MNSTDAITPLLYPSLMDDDKFIVDLFKIKIRTIDNTITTDYYSFLTKYKKTSWISNSLEGITSFLKPSNTTNSAYDAAKTPYCLSKKDAEIVSEIKKIFAFLQTRLLVLLPSLLLPKIHWFAKSWLTL